jgi:DNA-binding NarL/FixJ family response regulator
MGLVGRAAELTALEAVVGGGALLLVGEAGMGKTALLDALDPPAGVRLLRGTASALDRVRPFGPLLDALGRAERPTPGTRGTRWSPLQTVPDERAARVDELVEALLADLPAVLVVDDLHVADAATLATLARLARLAPDGLALVGARRPHPVTPELAALLDVWTASGGATLELGALAVDDLAALAADRLGAAPEPELLAAVERSGGNPFLAAELLAALDATGVLIRDGDRVGLGEGAALSAEARDSVLARFATLDDETTEVLRTASSVGLRFTAAELATVLDRPVARVLGPVGRAMDQGLLVADGDWLRFRHELVHEAIESTIAPALRAPLQLDIARRLGDAGVPPDRLVAHYLLGARPGDRDAVAVLRQVGGDIAGQAPQITAQLLERARGLLSSTDPEIDLVTADLVDALMWSGDLEAAESLAVEALARPLPADLAARLHESAARAVMPLGRPGDAVAHIAAIDAPPDRAAWVRGLASIFRLFALDLEGARVDAEAALELDRQQPDPWAACLGLLVLGWIENVQGYFDQAVAHCDRAVAIADDSAGREVHRLVPHVFRAMALVNAGRVDDGLAAVREGRRLAGDLSTAWAAPFFHYVVAQGHWTTGALDALLAEVEEGLRAAAELDAWLAAPWAYAVAAAGHLYQGRTEEAGRRLDAGEALLGSSGAQFGLDWLLWMRGLHTEAVAGPAAALPLLQDGWEAARGLQAGAALSLLGPDLVRLLVVEGRRDEAADVLAALAEGETAGERTAVDVLVLRCRGLVEGDLDAIAEARRRHEAEGRRLEVLLDDEAAALVAGDARTVEATADEAAAAGVAFVAHRLRQVRAPRRRPSHGWESLTRSEWRIARLVGEGRSNPEIAAELVVSRRTVESHLSRIFTKLAVANRTELALELRDHEAIAEVR